MGPSFCVSCRQGALNNTMLPKHTLGCSCVVVHNEADSCFVTASPADPARDHSASHACFAPSLGPRAPEFQNYNNLEGRGLHSPLHREAPAFLSRQLSFKPRQPANHFPFQVTCGPPGSSRFLNGLVQLATGAAAEFFTLLNPQVPSDTKWLRKSKKRITLERKEQKLRKG